jgi:PTS system mannose-specific IIB component/fructoselysine and glucoselysine-specific PTS system IIB component
MDRIVVVDDELTASPWEQELYCLGVPPAIDAAFSTVEEARRDLQLWRSDSRRLIVLVRDVDTLARLAETRTIEGEDVNLGGIHFAPGRERILPYLFLSPDEQAKLRQIAEGGVRLSARDLPTSRAVPLQDLLRTD